MIPFSPQVRDYSRQRAFEQLARYEAASRLGGATAKDAAELALLARVFDIDPEGLSFTELWQALAPDLFASIRI